MKAALRKSIKLTVIILLFIILAAFLYKSIFDLSEPNPDDIKNKISTSISSNIFKSPPIMWDHLVVNRGSAILRGRIPDRNIYSISNIEVYIEKDLNSIEVISTGNYLEEFIKPVIHPKITTGFSSGNYSWDEWRWSLPISALNADTQELLKSSSLRKSSDTIPTISPVIFFLLLPVQPIFLLFSKILIIIDGGYQSPLFIVAEITIIFVSFFISYLKPTRAGTVNFNVAAISASVMSIIWYGFLLLMFSSIST